MSPLSLFSKVNRKATSQSKPTHNLGRNLKPSPEQKLSVEDREDGSSISSTSSSSSLNPLLEKSAKVGDESEFGVHRGPSEQEQQQKNQRGEGKGKTEEGKTMDQRERKKEGTRETKDEGNRERKKEEKRNARIDREVLLAWAVTR